MCIRDPRAECGTRETCSALWELETRGIWSLPSRLLPLQVGNSLTLGGNRRAEEWAFFKVLGFYSIGLLLVFL